MNFLDKYFKEINKKQAISWAFYDFANSSYAMLILSFVYAVYFRDVIAGGGNLGDFWWGLAISVSILLGGLSSPIIGAIADYDTKRKKKFIIFALLSIVGTASLYFTGPGLLIFSLFIFILTNLFFEIAQTLYDSFLIHVSTEETSGRISGLGWGLGYFGGIIAMLLFKPLYENGFIGALEPIYKLTFPLTALFFLIFSIPSFLFIKEKEIYSGNKTPLLKLIKISFKNVFSTLKNIKQHKRIAWFLVAFYLMNDALVTIFAFIPIYASATLNMSLSQIFVIFLIVQLIAFPSTILFGYLSDKKGQKRMLLISLLLWCLVVILLASLKFTLMGAYLVAALTGLAVGPSQAIARSWFSKIIPKEKRSEFFGFNGFANKISATTGPLVFGLISLLTSNQRIAMIALLPYFIISFIIFKKIKE